MDLKIYATTTKLLKEALNSQTLIGISDPRAEGKERIIGFLIGLTDEYGIINEINEYGYFVGNVYICLKDITYVDVNNDRYLKRLLFIHKHCNELNINKQVSIWQKRKKLQPYFRKLITNKIMATIYFSEDDHMTGFISHCDNEDIMLDCISSEGEMDGSSCYPIDKIIGLRYNSLAEQKIKLLYDNRNLFADADL